MTDSSTSAPKDAVALDRTVLQDLFAKLDPALTQANFDAFMANAGPDEATAVSNVFTTLRTLLLGESGPIDTTDVSAITTRMNAAMDGGLHGTVVNLASMNVDDLVKLADSDIGARYSLVNGLSFAITADDAMYNGVNQDGSLFKFDPTTGERNLTDNYIHDRAVFLQAHLVAPSGTATATGTDSWDFEDRNVTDSGGNSMRLSVTGTDSAAATHRMTFGDNAPDGEMISGGNTSDELFGGGGDDMMRGGAGDDYMEGGKGNDLLDGGRGNDTLAGGAGEDELDGGFGNDSLTGGSGADDLTGGAGDDHLDGGDGFDTYNIDTGDGHDTIVDSDGKGAVLFDGTAVKGATVIKDGTWTSDDGKLTFNFAGDSVDGGELTITVSADQTIKIHDFKNGDLGIKLGDGTATALAETVAPSAGSGIPTPPSDLGALFPPNGSDGGSDAPSGSPERLAVFAPPEAHVDDTSPAITIAPSATTSKTSGVGTSDAIIAAVAPVDVAPLSPDYQSDSVIRIASPAENAIRALLDDPVTSIPFVTGEQADFALRMADTRYFTGAAPQDSAFMPLQALASADVAHALLDFHDASTDDTQLGSDKAYGVSDVDQSLAGFDATSPEDITARISTDLKPATIGLGKVGLK